MSIQENIENKSFVVKESLRVGEIPPILVFGKTLPEAWENAVLSTYEFGASIKTEYDQEVDPESRDASVIIVIANPMEEPRIHKAIPCGFDDLEIYRQEVVAGVHDNHVGSSGWSYSYHDRLVNWPGIGSWKELDGVLGKNFDLPYLNQIDNVIKKLAETPYSRRAQAITWVPWIDGVHHEPPCLQRIWCRIVKSEDEYLLEMNTHWRSRDAFKAAFMNIYAITDLQRIMTEKISDLSGKDVKVGRYLDFVDSFHIYGSYIRKGEIEKFINNLKNNPFEKRVVRSDNPLIIKEFARGRKRIEEENKVI